MDAALRDFVGKCVLSAAGRSPSALDAAVAASSHMPRGTYAWHGQESGSPAEIVPSAVDAASVALLWRIRRRLGSDTMPLLQFVRGDGGKGGHAAAAGLGRAAAVLIGRTLLVQASGVATGGAMPDAFTKRLYHQTLTGSGACALLSQAVDPGGRPAGAFAAIVIDQVLSAADDAAYAVAPLCRGTVIVVRAGVTRLRDVRDTAQRIQAVGGAVLGTVFIPGRH